VADGRAAAWQCDVDRSRRQRADQRNLELLLDPKRLGFESRLDFFLELIGELAESWSIGRRCLTESFQQAGDETALACKIAVPDPAQVRLAPRAGQVIFEPGAEGINFEAGI
jgi:hypothetical protein